MVLTTAARGNQCYVTILSTILQTNQRPTLKPCLSFLLLRIVYLIVNRRYNVSNIYPFINGAKQF